MRNGTIFNTGNEWKSEILQYKKWVEMIHSTLQEMSENEKFYDTRKNMFNEKQEKTREYRLTLIR